MASNEGSCSDYELITLVGEGSYGKVYKAMEKKTKRIVAVKIVDLGPEWMPLLAEVNMVIDLAHPSIVNYYNWFFSGANLWLVMEFCDGGSLSDMMRVLKRPLSELEISAVMRGVLESLVYVHSKQRVHRDIKAGNILVTSQGVVKLCDFGVSTQLEDGLKGTTLIGSPAFMAPEVIKSEGHGTSADIWSLGVMAIELFSGAPPYNGPAVKVMKEVTDHPPPTPSDKASELFKAFVKRMLVVDPAGRPTAGELLEDPFIAQTPKKVAAEIVRDLVKTYNVVKSSMGDEEEDEEEEEEEEEEEYEDEGFFSNPEVAATILFSDGTMVNSGTMVMKEGAGGNKVPEGWKPEFLEAPKTAAVQKRRFRNFKEQDLRTMLTTLKNVAETQLKSGAIQKKLVIQNYEEVRQAIVKELQRRDKTVPDDFERLDP